MEESQNKLSSFITESPAGVQEVSPTTVIIIHNNNSDCELKSVVKGRSVPLLNLKVPVINDSVDLVTDRSSARSSDIEFEFSFQNSIKNIKEYKKFPSTKNNKLQSRTLTVSDSETPSVRSDRYPKRDRSKSAGDKIAEVLDDSASETIITIVEENNNNNNCISKSNSPYLTAESVDVEVSDWDSSLPQSDTDSCSQLKVNNKINNNKINNNKINNNKINNNKINNNKINNNKIMPKDTLKEPINENEEDLFWQQICFETAKVVECSETEDKMILSSETEDKMILSSETEDKMILSSETEMISEELRSEDVNMKKLSDEENKNNKNKFEGIVESVLLSHLNSSVENSEKDIKNLENCILNFENLKFRDSIKSNNDVCKIIDELKFLSQNSLLSVQEHQTAVRNLILKFITWHKIFMKENENNNNSKNKSVDYFGDCGLEIILELKKLNDIRIQNEEIFKKFTKLNSKLEFFIRSFEYNQNLPLHQQLNKMNDKVMTAFTKLKELRYSDSELITNRLSDFETSSSLKESLSQINIELNERKLLNTKKINLELKMKELWLKIQAQEQEEINLKNKMQAFASKLKHDTSTTLVQLDEDSLGLAEMEKLITESSFLKSKGLDQFAASQISRI